MVYNVLDTLIFIYKWLGEFKVSVELSGTLQIYC